MRNRTGKTAAFLLPLLQTLKYAQGEAPRGLVLAPTKELVVQIHQEALKFASYTDLRIVAFYGGVGPKKQIEEIADGVDLIVLHRGGFRLFPRPRRDESSNTSSSMKRTA